MDDSAGLSLLLVHAHPDDEAIGTGATMAKYADEGVQVTLVTCTLGEEGEVLVPELAHLASSAEDRLGPHRKGEWEAAMKALGITDHRLLGGEGAYRDTGMAWVEGGGAGVPENVRPDTFWVADLLEPATALVEVIREVRPQVLLTYDQYGGYGHPDHIQAHRVATYGTALAAAASYRPELGAAWDVPKVYWGCLPRSWARKAQERMLESGSEFFGGGDPDDMPMFTDDDLVTTRVDGSAYVERKLAAMREYPTQIQLDGPFFALSNQVGNEVFGQEFYRLVKGRLGPLDPQTGQESDLFAGLRAPAPARTS